MTKGVQGAVDAASTPSLPLLAKNSEGFDAPAGITADPVVLTVRQSKLQALVVPAEVGGLGLPGGFVDPSETAEETAVRKLREKTGLDWIYFEQLGAFTDPARDPRGWIPSVAFLALVPPDTAVSEAGARWVDARRPPRLAYDHNDMLALAVDRIEGKLWWSNIAVGVLPKPFTMTDARQVYEAISGASYDPSTFARDLRATGLVVQTGEKLKPPVGRRVTLYKFRRETLQWGAGRKKRV